MSRVIQMVVGALACAASTATAQAEHNPSPYQTRTEQYAEVSKIKIEGPFQIFVMSGGRETSVSFSGPPELLADASARIEDGVLVIGFREGAAWSWNPGSGMQASITLPSLESVETEGAAQVETLSLDGTVPRFSAVVNGAGKIKVSQLEAQNVSLAVGGAGLIDIDGAASDVAYSLGGSGTIDAKRLRATNGAIALGGAGSIYADISGQAQINVGGAGHVEVVGGATCNTTARGASQVECR